LKCGLVRATGRLEAVIGSGNSPQKHVWRARIVLLSAEGVGTMAIQRQTGKGKPTIWRWQARFMAEGVEGLLHEATRPPGKPPLTPATIEQVVNVTLAEPPGEATHWTCRAMAKAAGVSHRSVQRIWAAHEPHRVRTFKLSNDPKFAAKARVSSASMSIRRSTGWYCRSTRNPRSRRSTAPSPDCQ
jgi:transposase